MARRKRTPEDIWSGAVAPFAPLVSVKMAYERFQLEAAPKKRHAPKSFISTWLRLAIVETATHLEARELDRQRESIIKEVCDRFRVERATVFDAFRRIDPYLHLDIVITAANDAGLGDAATDRLARRVNWDRLDEMTGTRWRRPS
jgi:hypothetical protein